PMHTLVSVKKPTRSGITVSFPRPVRRTSGPRPAAYRPPTRPGPGPVRTGFSGGRPRGRSTTARNRPARARRPLLSGRSHPGPGRVDTGGSRAEGGHGTAPAARAGSAHHALAPSPVPASARPPHATAAAPYRSGHGHGGRAAQSSPPSRYRGQREGG